MFFSIYLLIDWKIILGMYDVFLSVHEFSNYFTQSKWCVRCGIDCKPWPRMVNVKKMWNNILTCIHIVRGREVRVLDLESFAHRRFGFESQTGTLPGSFVWGSYPAIVYGTSVVLLGCPLVPAIMHVRSSSINKAGKSPYNLYSVGAT